MNRSGTGNDSIFTGSFALNSEPVNLVLTSAGGLSGMYTLMTWTSGGFTDLSQIDLAGSSPDIAMSELSIFANSLLLTVAVPEPRSIALFGAAAVALAVLRRRRRNDS